MKKENRRIRLSKKLIKDSLRKLLLNKSLNKIRINELCILADVNRSTFYNNYDSLNEVVNEIGEEITEDFLKATKDKTNSNLKDQVIEICTYIKEHPEDSKFLFENFTPDEEVIKKLFRKRIITNQVSLSNEILSCDEKSKEMIFIFLIHGIFNLLKVWIEIPNNKTPEEIGQLAEIISYNGWLQKIDS